MKSKEKIKQYHFVCESSSIHEYNKYNNNNNSFSSTITTMKGVIHSIRNIISLIVQLILHIYDTIQIYIQQRTGKVITFNENDSSATKKRSIVIGKQIAEGGFSYIFIGYDISSQQQQQRWGMPSRKIHTTKNSNNNRQRHKQYAVKRIHCPDKELIEQCVQEANVHRTVMKCTTTTCKNQYVMPLFGFTIVQNIDCYMLFPLCTESLRHMINRKNLYLQQQPSSPTTTSMNNSTVLASSSSFAMKESPISEMMVLQLFRQVCYGVQALHICGYTHRDIKLENVLIYSHSSNTNNPSFHTVTTVGGDKMSTTIPHLVLMDCGSAGSLQTTISSRKQILEIVELASQHTTISYRPPELFDGGLQLPYNNNSASSSSSSSHQLVLDYCAVDVWSLGCTLHAIMYGASPFECEFVSNNNSSSSMIKIVDCTHLSIIGNIPIPKYSPISSWYTTTSVGNQPILRNELLLPMLQQDPKKRPKLNDIIQTVESMIQTLGGTIIDMPSISDDVDDHDITGFGGRTGNQYRDHYYNDNDDLDGSKDSNLDGDDGDGIALLSRVT